MSTMKNYTTLLILLLSFTAIAQTKETMNEFDSNFAHTVYGSFTYSLIVSFESAEAQQNYQDEAPHKRFVEESSKLWTKVIVYDSQGI